MRTSTVQAFTGLDLRLIDEASPYNSFREATNVDLTVGGGFEVRDQLRLFAIVDPLSVGLYVAGDKLRCAYPLVLNTPAPKSPVGITYDFIGNSPTGYQMSAPPTAVTSAQAWLGDPYIMVVNGTDYSTRWEAHYLPEETQVTLISIAAYGGSANTVTTVATIPDTVTAGATVWFQGPLGTPDEPYLVQSVTLPHTLVLTGTAFTSLPANCNVIVFQPGTTRQDLPFNPGPAMVVANNRVWIGDWQEYNVHYSSIGTVNDWSPVSPSDSGFLPTATHVDGDQTLSGLSIWKNYLCVYYARTVQQWDCHLDDPSTFSLLNSIGGAGTAFPKSVANVMGDSYYFSQGGFREMSAVITTGQAKEGDLGVNIQPLTNTLGTSSVPPLVAVWSPSRSQYMCCVGSQIFCYTYSPVANITGWTMYQIPFTVSDMVEYQANVYLRESGTGNIYIFDANYTQEPGFAWKVRFPFFDFNQSSLTNTYGEPHYYKQFKMVVMHMLETCDMYLYVNPQNMAEVEGPIPVGGVTAGFTKIVTDVGAEMVSHEFNGTDYCRIDAFLVRFDMGNVV